MKARGDDGKLRDTVAWQVRRDEFDHDLLDTAIQRGAGFLKGAVKDVLRAADGAIIGVIVEADGGSFEVPSKVVLDASGQSTFLASRGVTSPKQRGGYDRQGGFFSQMSGVQLDPGPAAGNTLIFYREKHHWAWLIPLDEKRTSIGVVTPAASFRAAGLSPEGYFHEQIRNLNPQLTWRLDQAACVEPVRTASNYSYRVEHFTGKGYICVGDSHRFVDPIFSFGVFFAMREARFAADAIESFLSGRTAHLDNPFAAYEEMVERGQRIIQDLIDCFWEFPLAFQRMAYHTHVEDIIDCFAGRIYPEDDKLSEGVLAMRRMLAKKRGEMGTEVPLAG